jgi:serine kinase of HPr protein (carbohydrate metabolism regulator)
MQIHASCVALAGSAVLLTGQSGCGKSDLALRLLHLGFLLVADDQVIVEDRVARAPAGWAGLLEIRGIGIVQLGHVAAARLALVARLLSSMPVARLPEPSLDEQFGVPLIQVDPWHASAAHKIALALQCAQGDVRQLAGAFAS